MKITKRSPFSGKTHTRNIQISRFEYAEWQGGALIQDAMPNASADDREFIMTGYTPEDWEKMFGEDNET